MRPLRERFPADKYPHLLIGLGRPDDAAVYRLDEERALICTADFITPVVDEAYDYGYIAAVNAVSDVYAMGGEVLLALNLAALPPELPAGMVAEIFRGGADAVAAAGAVIAGGHTIDDAEPKYGLSVVGMVPLSALMTKSAARPGEVVVLTKPLGVGMVTTAAMGDAAEPAHLETATTTMKRSNRRSSQALKAVGARCVTDVTGFGLLGHAAEVAGESGVRLRLHFDGLPFVPGAKQYAREWLFPAGACKNESAYAEQVTFASGLDQEYRTLVFTPETAGGLLATLPPERLLDLKNRLAGDDLWVVGETAEGAGVVVD